MSFLQLLKFLYVWEKNRRHISFAFSPLIEEPVSNGRTWCWKGANEIAGFHLLWLLSQYKQHLWFLTQSLCGWVKWTATQIKLYVAVLTSRKCVNILKATKDCQVRGGLPFFFSATKCLPLHSLLAWSVSSIQNLVIFHLRTELNLTLYAHYNK